FGSRARAGAALIHCPRIDDLAKQMDDDQMQLLDARRAARRHSYEMVDAVASLCSSVSGEERGDRAGIMPRPKSTQHVLRPAGGRDAEHDVASVGQATDLPGKDLGIAVVIGDRGHRRCVSIESDRGKRLALAASPPEKLGGKMAGLGRAAAVAEGDDLITVSERLADRVAKCLDRWKHIREHARALEMLVEHLAQPLRSHRACSSATAVETEHLAYAHVTDDRLARESVDRGVVAGE